MTAMRAQKHKLVGNNIAITLKYTRTQSVTRSRDMNHYTNDAQELYENAYLLLEEHYNHEPIRLIGITLNNIMHESKVLIQTSLFDRPVPKKQDEIDELIRTINKEGKAQLMKASDIIKQETE